MIFTERKITVRNGKSSIDEPVILYRGDFEVELRFTIMETKYRFKSDVNLVDSEKAPHAQLALLAPDGTNVFTEIGGCEDGTAIFVLSKEMIDELSEVGLYSFQIRLFDYYRESRITIPPIEFGIEVREPIAAEDHINTVNDAMVGYSIAKTSVIDEPVPEAFDANGQYNKTDWETGDRISEGKLNKIEDAIYTINENEIKDTKALNKQMTSNYNALQTQIDNLIVELNQKADYVVANNFEGANGGEKIQNALNSKRTGKGIRMVLVDSKCGDEDVWLIKSPLKIESNTCLILNGCYLKLDDGVNNAIINNSDFDKGNENIHIIGIGNPILDCNRPGQNLDLNNYKNIGLHLYNVMDFTIKGITLKDCARWSLVPEKCHRGLIDDIYFDNVGYVNQDGVHIIGPSSKIVCTKIRGKLGDDACVVNARLAEGATRVFQGYGTGGDISEIIFNDINIEGGDQAHTGILRTSASPTSKISDIIISNAIGYNLIDGALRIGGNDATDMDLHGSVFANNIVGYAKGNNALCLINFLQPASNIKVTNAVIHSGSRKNVINTNYKNIKNVSIENIDYIVEETDTSTNGGASAFYFRDSVITDFTAKNVKFIHKEPICPYDDSVIIKGMGATLDNIVIDGFYSKNITGFMDRNGGATIGKVRIDNYTLDNSGFDANAHNAVTDNIILNGLYKFTGTAEEPLEEVCNIGDIVRYKCTLNGNNPYINYLKVSNNAYKQLTDGSQFSTVIERHENVTVGTILAKSYNSFIIAVEDSANAIFYQLKPGFDIKGGLLYSYSNKKDGEIKLTIFNAMDTDYTFSTSEDGWISIKTYGK